MHLLSLVSIVIIQALTILVYLLSASLFVWLPLSVCAKFGKSQNNNLFLWFAIRKMTNCGAKVWERACFLHRNFRFLKINDSGTERRIELGATCKIFFDFVPKVGKISKSLYLASQISTSDQLWCKSLKKCGSSTQFVFAYHTIQW